MQKVQPLSVTIRPASGRVPPRPQPMLSDVEKPCRVCGKLPVEHGLRLFIAHLYEGVEKKDGTIMTAEESRLLAQKTVEPFVAKLPAIFEALAEQFTRYD